MRRGRITLAALLCCISLSAWAAPLTLIMTTSIEASGLGPYLRAAYYEDTGAEVRAIITGSGQAYAAVRHGTIDVIMTHEPDGAKQLYDSGFITRPRPFMANHFILVGPVDDPIGVSKVAGLEEGFVLLRERQARFVSRGDLSGTHKREERLWALTGMAPDHKDYIKAGIGMAGALRMADQLEAYTLTEPGSFLTAARGLDLAIMIGDDQNVENRYEISMTKDADDRGQAFADWLLSPLGQSRIASFTVDNQHPYRPIRTPLQ